MPTRPVILALSVAIAVVVASMWLLRPASTTSAIGPQPVLDLDAASITALELTGDAEAAARVERTTIGWQLVRDGAPPWAIQEGRARAAARILADLQGRPVEGSQDLPPIAATLTIRDARGRTMSLGLREPVVGGRRVIDRVDAQGNLARFSIDEPLYEMFVQTGLSAWRDEGLLGGLAGRPARVELARGSSRTEIARVDGAWSLRFPVATRANEQAIDTLLAAIAGLRVERFDEPAPPLVDASEPVTITIEADIVQPGEGEPVRTTERLVLSLHGAADTSGRLTLVGVTREREQRRAGATIESLGTSYVAIDLASLETVALDARSFVARTTLEGDASLISTLTLNERTYTRTADAWAEGETELPAERTAALSAIATMLTETQMAGVELTGQPQPLGRPSEPVAIRAETITGETLGPAEGHVLYIIEATGGSGVLVVGENVTREYLDAQSLAIGRAALVLAQPAEAPDPGDQ
ncbi:MAG: hypothetical protein ACIAQU_09250 [Phycisphaerales bacterium JB064]